MPGPKSTPSSLFKFPVGDPNKRSAKRLAAREAAFTPNVQGHNRPGSQNRKK